MIRPILPKQTLPVVLTAPLFSVVLAGSAMAAEPGAPRPESAMSNLGSWAALGILVWAFLIAWLLNHAQPKLRAAGTALAGLACFGVVGWFIAALGSGVIAAPKAFQAPMDALKPTLLWAQTAAALIGGLVLFGLAARQFGTGNVLSLQSANEPSRYGRVSRVIHWTTAILFISMIPMGIFMSMIHDGAWYRTEYADTHETIGVVILALTLVRVVWHFRSKRPALEASLTPMEHTLAHRAHQMLYVLLFAVPITGYMMTTLHGFPLHVFALRLDAPWGESEMYAIWGLFHKYVLQYVIYLILGAHVLGALKHQFIDKHDNAFKRMVS